MAYEWNIDLETGNEVIDKQHKELFSVLNSLLEAQRLGKGKEEIGKTVEFLTAYVLQHFKDEERLQEEYGYPDILNHKSYHVEFKNKVKKLIEELEKDGYSDAVIDKTINVVTDWLVNHIKSDDFRLAAHVQSVKAAKK
jgi:hemerythrin